MISIIKIYLRNALSRYFLLFCPSHNAYSSKTIFQPLDKSLYEFVLPHFDSELYLKTNPDVRQAGLDPLTHWLRYGLLEGRAAPPLEVFQGLKQNEKFGWHNFLVGDRQISLRVRHFKSGFLSEIIEQARFELNLLGPGANAIKNLPIFWGDDLISRDGVKVSTLYEGLPSKLGVLIATPMLCAGGAEKYVADLVKTLVEFGHSPVLVMVTAQTRQQAQGWEQIKILEPLRGHFIKFWSDSVESAHGGPLRFALFAQSLRPKFIIANNSQLALEAIARFGLGLSQYSNLYCTYFSISHLGLGAPFGARFPSLTCRYATSLTDNEVMQKTLNDLTDSIPGSNVALLRPLTLVLDRERFQRRLFLRRILRNTSSQRRWLWLSRVEPAKGVDILRRIAWLMPNDQFDVYGPLESSARYEEEKLPNLRFNGILLDVSAADFTMYDGFIFTSFFEGMPNVVLEMAQHAIPLVLADVGGLTHTFKEGSALFIGHDKEVQITAIRFAETLLKLATMSVDEVERMVCDAYDRVEARHGAVAYKASLRVLLEKAKYNGN